jgi:hypothetical protein
VENGLDCSVDAYKQVNLGVSVLKGIGAWSADIQSHADFYINIERPGGRTESVGLTVPKAWRADFGLLEEKGTAALPVAGPEDDQDKKE